MLYVYQSHLGGFYTTTEELDYDDLYCDSCGDSDFLIGTLDGTKTDAQIEEVLESYSDYYAEGYIKKTIEEIRSDLNEINLRD